jgi:hypothetical protein
VTYRHPLAFLLGLEGVALLRAFAGDGFDREFTEERVAEVRSLLAAYLSAHGHQVLGIDSSPDVLTRARQQVPGARFPTAGRSRTTCTACASHG